MTAILVAEIEEIHHLVGEWMSGRAPKSDETLHRLEAVLHPKFVLIPPNGIEADRETFLEQIRSAWEKRSGVHFWAENIVLICETPTFVVARFDEYDKDDRMEGVRVSTAVFEYTNDTPNGLSWLRLHETRITKAG
jgi:hypothetical protein